MEKSAIERACEVVGGQVKLAELLKVTPQAVNQWVAKQRVPLDRVKAVVLAARGRVSAHELAPDLYPVGFEFPTEAAA